MNSYVNDNALGTMLGLAVGDALGTSLEFSERDALPHQTEMTGGGPFGLEPGQWTDDTSMALALADSIILSGGLDPRDLMERFVAWRDHGHYSCTGECFDIGMTTSDALDRYRDTGNPYSGQTDSDMAGNGSLMRIAPVALYTLWQPEMASTLARDQSRTTHGAAQAIEACDFFVGLLREAILGAGRGDVLKPRPRTGHPDITGIAGGDWRNKTWKSIRSSGYVSHTLEAAIWSVGNTTTFEEALILAVNLADDSDTVGAVTGQLAGAIYGAKAIPERWLTRLAWRDKIDALSNGLVDIAPK